MALKIKLKQVAGTPTTSDLENGEIAHNTSANTLHIRIGNTIHSVSSSGGGGSVDLSAVDQDIIPDANNTRSLGSASKRFSDLFLSGQTINLGGATLSSDGTGSISISAAGVTLPENSKAGTSKIAVANDEGVVVRKVNLFTAAGGLSTAATTFLFKASGSRDIAFTDLTFANGSSLSSTQSTQLFEF
tara:strand:- start:351 stop:914 length:564 start_codon:yes stop_codon:yes gene_type:complete